MAHRSSDVKLHPLMKHGFLVAILALLAFNLWHLAEMIRTDYPYARYGNVVISLLLLLNHISFFYTTQGKPSVIMKTVASAWLIFAIIYIALSWPT